MAKRKKPIAADDPLRDLTRAVRRLGPDQGMVARRNAREDVLDELRRLRAFIDKEYPPIRSTSPARRKPKRGLARVHALKCEGWVPVFDSARETRLLAAGLPVVRVPLLKKDKAPDTMGGYVFTHGKPYVRLTRQWVNILAPRMLTLVELQEIAALSPTERNARLMEAKLKRDENEEENE